MLNGLSRLASSHDCHVTINQPIRARIISNIAIPVVASDLLPTSQPSEDARLASRQHYRAVRKYCVGGKNLECSRGMFVR